MKLILSFTSIKEKNIKVDENGCNYILFRVDVYISEYNLAVEVDEKGYTERDLIFVKRKETPEKNLIVNLLELMLVNKIMIQIMKLDLINQLFENLKGEQFNLHLKTMLGVLIDMQLISIYKKGIKYFLCAIDLFSKYVWVVPLKDKKGATIVNALLKTLESSNRKPNKIWVDEGSEFPNDFLKNG